ncbi:signal transduction protein [Neorhizobium sp. P12A]|uniref:EF-hand domain-containing protein n=1 Tax=Neorhizobium sp. P12A TaxID=2268027 RepID=UPI0011EEC3F4|nr:EF-hand domain-containing protein [Neorhizobium sp. P12A]KAA0685359.1 signal transduction protein [Neorhizobium sp. P12A]
MRTSTMFAALLIGFAPLSAHAQDATGDRIFRAADTNGDGVISKEEALAARQHLFSRLDRNGDGVIDKDEIDGASDAIMARAEAAEARLSIAMRRLDTNGDGKVSADEFLADMSLFDLADRNSDGKISPSEAALVRNLFAGHHD